MSTWRSLLLSLKTKLSAVALNTTAQCVVVSILRPPGGRLAQLSPVQVHHRVDELRPGDMLQVQPLCNREVFRCVRHGLALHRYSIICLPPIPDILFLLFPLTFSSESA